MKPIFTCSNRRNVQFRKPGIYVVLPFHEPNDVDSVISWNGKQTLWLFDARDSWKIYTFGGEIKFGLSQNEFLEKLRIFYPEDFSFFLWHPEALNGEWTAGEIPHDKH
jgi:hypothetical protein